MNPLDLITGFLPDIWGYLAAGAAALVAVVVAYIKGGSAAKAKQAVKNAKAEAKAHERMNDADLGVGATDSERIERLRDFAAKHGNGQAKGKGG